MPYDKGPHPIELPSDVVHETEGAIWEALALADERLSLEASRPCPRPCVVWKPLLKPLTEHKIREP